MYPTTIYCILLPTLHESYYSRTLPSRVGGRGGGGERRNGYETVPLPSRYPVDSLSGSDGCAVEVTSPSVPGPVLRPIPALSFRLGSDHLSEDHIRRATVHKQERRNRPWFRSLTTVRTLGPCQGS